MRAALVGGAPCSVVRRVPLCRLPLPPSPTAGDAGGHGSSSTSLQQFLPLPHALCVITSESTDATTTTVNNNNTNFDSNSSNNMSGSVARLYNLASGVAIQQCVLHAPIRVLPSLSTPTHVDTPLSWTLIADAQRLHFVQARACVMCVCVCGCAFVLLHVSNYSVGCRYRRCRLLSQSKCCSRRRRRRMRPKRRMHTSLRCCSVRGSVSTPTTRWRRCLLANGDVYCCCSLRRWCILLAV